MFKKIFLCLAILCLASLSVVSAIEISPTSIDADVKQGQYAIRYIHITNNENHTINVSLSTELSISFSSSYFTLIVNQSKDITVYLFGDESQGCINVTYDGNTTCIPVNITVPEVTTENENITIFPPIPNSGELFVIALDKPANLSGFIWIKNKIIPVDIQNGFAIVEIEETLYGEAQLWLYGKGFVHTFNIECGIEGNAVIEAPGSTKIDEIATITLKIGDKHLANTEITVTDPTGLSYPFETDDNGKIYPLMDKLGDWIIRTEFRGKQTVKKITVIRQTMSVSVNKQVLNLGETVIITTGEQNVDIVIKRNGISQFQTNVNSGTLEYNPLSSGQYTVDAESGNKKGSASFTVNMQTSIRILDKNNMQTSVVKQGGEYIVQVVDENNQLVPAYQSITARMTFLQSQQLESESLFDPSMVTIPLNNGLGFWQPEIYGTYTLSVGNNGNYIGSSIDISIEQVEEMDMSLIYILIGIVVAIVIIILLFYLYKKGLITVPNLPKHKKIPDNLL